MKTGKLTREWMPVMLFNLYPSRRHISVLSSLMCMVILFMTASVSAQIGRVGINTTTPAAMLHVKDSSVVFTGTATSLTPPPPVSGPGMRMMWFPQRAAFRAGYVDGNQWDKLNIGSFSFATGFGTRASGLYSFASGWDNKASQDFSFASGNNTIANTIGLFAIGRFNDTTAINNSWSDNDQLFAIGNGTSTINRKNAFTVLKGGNVGIGNSLPHAPLHFNNAAANRKIVLSELANNDHQFYGLGSGTNQLRFQIATLTGSFGFYTGAGSGASNELVHISGSGKVGIGVSTPNERLEVGDDGRAFFGNGADVNRIGLLIDGVDGPGARIESYDYSTNTGRPLLINSTGGGFVGINENSPHGQLHLSNTVDNRKLILYETLNNPHQFYGFGINTATLRYQVTSANSSHVFFAGTSDTTSTELMRIKGDGNVGIGNNNPLAPLHFNNAPDNRKIVLSSVSNNDHQFYGLGSGTNLIQYQVGATTGAHAFFAGVNSTTSNELMRITGTGNVGIGITNPHAPLQFNSAADNRKIVLNEVADNDHQFYGLGSGSNLMQYQISSPSGAHAFFAGTSSTTSTELFRIQGDGKIGIGNAAPASKLQVSGGVEATLSMNGFLQLGETNASNIVVDNNEILARSNGAVANLILQEEGGNVGIGNLIPNQKLVVEGNGAFSGSVGIGNTTPDASAILDLTSTTKGMLMPRMTTAERNAIVSPAIGLTVFDLTTGSYWYRNATEWVNVATTQTAWAMQGNVITGTEFIGTTSNHNLEFRANNVRSGLIDLPNLNTFFGYSAGISNTTGIKNVAIGSNALQSNNIGNKNVAVGEFSLFTNTQGQSNTAVGDSSLFANSTGNQNIALGANALRTNSTGNDNIALGHEALNGYIDHVGNQNVAIGTRSLKFNTNGNLNVSIGYEALNGGEAAFNTAIGANALHFNWWGNKNVAVGYNSMMNSNVIGCTAIGAQAMEFGYYNYFPSELGNTAIGAEALRGNTPASANTGDNNTAIGWRSMRNNKTGHSNVGVGVYSLYSNISGFENISIGRAALRNNTSGNTNVAIGDSALCKNTTGNRLIAIGSGALASSITGTDKIAIGVDALRHHTGTLANNVAIGDAALFSCVSGNNNVAVGFGALNTTLGSYNTAVGRNALYLTTGAGNVGIGYISLAYSKYSYNSGLGYGSGEDSDNSTYCTYLGNDADNDLVANAYTNSTALGSTSRMTASNQVRIGNASVTSIGGFESWTDLSDGRFKNDIQEDVPGLSFITRLRPVTYHLDVNKLADKLNEDILHTRDPEKNEGPSSATLEARDQKAALLKTGFIAQDVEAVARELGYEFSGVDAPQSEDGLYGLRYSTFVVPLVKAVQEQQAMIETLQQENAALKNQYNTSITDLQQKLLHMEAMINEMKSANREP